MANISNLTPGTHAVMQGALGARKFYAVYDCCVPGKADSWDLAFIEEREGASGPAETGNPDELYFRSLAEAKAYVNEHFQSGAEYFSLAQLSDPDDLLRILTDKVVYLIA